MVSQSIAKIQSGNILQNVQYIIGAQQSFLPYRT